jgi:hypothetical protein
VPIHKRKSRGGGRGNESPELAVGDANTNCPPDFCHVSKFQAPDCLHYYAVKCTSLATYESLVSQID